MNIEMCLATLRACLVKALSLEAFEAEMKAFGWHTVIGHQAGDFSLVMISLCGRYAVKLFGDKAYDTFLDVVQADACNRYFPKIYQRMCLSRPLKGYTRLVLMERLYNEWEAIGKTPQAFAAYYDLKHSGNDFDAVNRADYGADFDRALRALEKARRQNSHELKCDLHGRNMMFRGNGELVITDPLSLRR